MSRAHPATAGTAGTARRLAVLGVFGAAMGWLEGVVVVYIRGLLGVGPGQEIPPPADVVARFGELPWLLPTEQSREAATLVMLAALAWLSARPWRARIGAFLVAFGVWDIAYYVALYAMLRWPPSLATMDVLFLIPPGPWWNQPVWVPVAISLAMIAVGAAWFVAGERGRPR